MTIEEFLRKFEEQKTESFEKRVVDLVESLEDLPFLEVQVLLAAMSILGNRFIKMQNIK